MAMTGTVKFFNGERGYGFIKPMTVDATCSSTSPRGARRTEIADRRPAHKLRCGTDKKGKGPKAVNLIITG